MTRIHGRLKLSPVYSLMLAMQSVIVGEEPLLGRARVRMPNRQYLVEVVPDDS